MSETKFDCSILTPRKFKAWLEKKGDEGVGCGSDPCDCPITHYVAETIGVSLPARNQYGGRRIATGHLHTTVDGVYCDRTPRSKLSRFVAKVDQMFPRRQVTAKQALSVLESLR